MRPGLTLVGSYPPPYGGCSVHVERLHEALVDDFDVAVVDLYGERNGRRDGWLVRCGRSKPLNVVRALFVLRRVRAGIVHFHVAGMDAFLFAGHLMLGVLPHGTRTIVTIHSGAFVERFERAPAWRRTMLVNLLRRFDRIVTVSGEQRAFLERLGIAAEKLAVVPAFLPPVARESERTRALYDCVRAYDTIVIASGYGLPHYGFHVILDALERLDASAARTGVLFCTYNSYDEAYMSTVTARLTARGWPAPARDLGPAEFAWLLERSAVYVRATDRDGDAVAVREASHYWKVVIASDCVARPPEAILFRTGDADSLAAALLAAGRTGDHETSVRAPDTLNALRSVYAAASA